MSKIVLLGGSSEIGTKVAEVLLKNKSEYSEIHYVSTSLSTSDSIWRWSPTGFKDVDNIFSEINLKKGDLVIISLGYLGEPYSLENLDYSLHEIEKIFNTNFQIPLMSMLRASVDLAKVGGGKIMVMTSSAAYPVLNTNLFYGNAKLSLDQIALRMAKVFSKNNVELTLVRSGFVPTKLNLDRKPTPFSRSADEVALIVLKNFDSKVIWTPKFFKWISLALTYIPPLRYLASRKVTESWK